MGTKYLDQIVPTLLYKGKTDIDAATGSTAAVIKTASACTSAITNSGLHKTPYGKEFYPIQDQSYTGKSLAQLKILINKLTTAMTNFKKYHGRYRNVFDGVTMPTQLTGATAASLAIQINVYRDIVCDNFRIGTKI